MSRILFFEFTLFLNIVLLQFKSLTLLAETLSG